MGNLSVKVVTLPYFVPVDHSLINELTAVCFNSTGTMTGTNIDYRYTLEGISSWCLLRAHSSSSKTHPRYIVARHRS